MTFFLGGVFIFMRDVVRLLYISFLSFTFTSCIPVLWPFDIHCTYLLIYIYIYMMMYVYSTISSCVVSFLSLYTYFLMYAIFYFYFTLRCLNEFCLKCFRKTGCQNLLCHELSSCKIFQEFVFGVDFIVFNKWLWVEWFTTSLILHLFVVVLSQIAKEGDCQDKCRTY